MRRPVEREFKLRATGPLEVAAVDAALREIGVAPRQVEQRAQRDRYFDDPAASLRGAGVGLRLREAGDRRRLTCKTRQQNRGNLVVRGELEVDWPDAHPPSRAAELPDPLRGAVLALTGDRELAATLELHTQREVRVLARDGRDACELVVDRVEARANGRTATFAEIELEVFADEAWVEAIAHELLARLPVAFATQDKPSHASALLGMELPRGSGAVDIPRNEREAREPVAREPGSSEPGSREPHLGEPATEARPEDRAAAAPPHPAPSPTEALRQDLATARTLADEIAAEPFAERAPKNVHQLRVTLRRMRNVARTASANWSEADHDALQDTLRTIAHRCGPVRDLDVLRERLGRPEHHLPPPLRSLAGAVGAWLADRAEAEHTGLRAWLEHERTDRFAAVDALLCADTTEPTAAPDAGRDADTDTDADSPSQRLTAAVRKLRKRVRDLPDDVPIEAAHRVRLAAKRVRDLARTFAPGQADRALKPVRRALRRLGALCDHEAACTFLAGQAVASDPPLQPELAAALGALAADRQAAAERARDRVRKALDRLDGKRRWRALHRLAGHARS